MFFLPISSVLFPNQLSDILTIFSPQGQRCEQVGGGSHGALAVLWPSKPAHKVTSHRTSPQECHPKSYVRQNNSTNSFICDGDRIIHRFINIIHRENLLNPIVQWKIQKNTIRFSFGTKIRTLVCVEIRYEALNIMHLIMKSLTNSQVLGNF